MFVVQWDNQEGNLEERTFESLEDAKIEAADLKEKFDGVMILDENGNEIVSYLDT